MYVLKLFQITLLRTNKQFPNTPVSCDVFINKLTCSNKPIYLLTYL